MPKEPEHDALRMLLERHALTRQEAANLLHLSVSAIHSWTAPIGSMKHRNMPTAYWELLLLKLGEHPTQKLVAK